MNIGDLLFALRGDGLPLQKDAEKAGAAAGDKAGKTFTDGLRKAVTKAQGNFSGGIMAGVGVGVGLGAFGVLKSGISAVTDAIGDSVAAAGKFDDKLRTINTVAKVSDAQLGSIGDSIQALSRETGKSTDDLTAGFYDLVSAGIPADKAMKVLKDSAVLATGALGTTGETVDLVTSALNAYGMSADESTRVTDIFATAVADGKVTAAELGQTLAQIAPLAASAGVSLEEVASGYALLTAKGVPAAQAATQMRAAISALLTPNAQLAALQKKVGHSFADIAREQGLAKALGEVRDATNGSDEAFAKALGSVEALGYALATTGDNAGAAQDELDRITAGADKGGVAMGQYAEKSKSAVEQQARLTATLETLQQDLGRILVGPASQFIGFLTDILGDGTNAEGAVHQLAVSMDTELVPALEAVKEAGSASGDHRFGSGTIFGSMVDGMHAFEDVLAPHGAEMEKWADSVLLVGDELGATREDLIDLAYAIKRHGGDFQAFQDWLTTLTRQAPALKGWGTGMTTSLLNVGNALAGVDFTPLLDSIDRLNGKESGRTLGVEIVTGYTDAVIPGMRQAQWELELAQRRTDQTRHEHQMADHDDYVRQYQRKLIQDTVALHGLLSSLLPGAFAAYPEAAKAAMEAAASVSQAAVRRTTVGMLQSLDAAKEPWRASWRNLAAWAKNPFRPSAFEDWLEGRAKAATRKARDAAENGKPGVSRRWKALAAAMRSPITAQLVAMGRDVDTAIAQVLSLQSIAKELESHAIIVTGAGLGNYTPSGGGGSKRPKWYANASPERQAQWRRNHPGMALGGPVFAGEAYTVGERGRETFVPSSDGTIVPHGGSRIDFYVHDEGGGLARAGISTGGLAAELAIHVRRRFED